MSKGGVVDRNHGFPGYSPRTDSLNLGGWPEVTSLCSADRCVTYCNLLHLLHTLYISPLSLAFVAVALSSQFWHTYTNMRSPRTLEIPGGITGSATLSLFFNTVAFPTIDSKWPRSEIPQRFSVSELGFPKTYCWTTKSPSLQKWYLNTPDVNHLNEWKA